MSVAENSKFISLVADNGTEFTSEQKAIFTIHPDIGFVKGKDSYISFDILNEDINNRVAVFPATAGASSVIDRMDIYSLANGQLLESLTNYNLWSSIENQYLEEDNQHNQIKNGVSPDPRAFQCSQDPGTKVNTITEVGRDLFHRSTGELGALNFSQISSGAGTQSDTPDTDIDIEMCAKKFAARKFCIPLKAGIFSHFGVSEKLTPILLFGGLRIEITFASDKRVMTRVYGKTDTADYKMDSYDNGMKVDEVTAGGGGATQTTLKQIIITEPVSDPALLGITRGAKMVLQKNAAGSGADKVLFVVEGVRRINSGTGVPSNKVCLTFNTALTAMTGTTSNRIYFQNATAALETQTYKLKNVELKVLQVIPPQNLMKSMIKESQFDFISWDCFLDNLPSSSLSHQSEITSVASAAKSIFTHYISVGHQDNHFHQNYYAGQPPHNTHLNSIQYFINNKLYPLKAYNPQAKNDKVVNMNEVVKAFQTIGKQVKKLGECRGGNIADYTNTYLHARELARGEQFVYNLKDAEPQIRLGFSQERSVAGTGMYAVNNARMIHFVFSVKTIMVNKDNLQLLL
tara:strand:- start:1585 stop:3306 length:1722 start_codon:yes stop_codon:yes gene_type:complete